MQGEFSLKNNEYADPNKTVQWGFFFSKLINVHARLFGTLEYIDYELKSADNPYVLTNFCKLSYSLRLTIL